MGHHCLRSGMSVSDGACHSPMKHVEVFDGSPIRHFGLRWVSDRSPMGLQWVSDWSPKIKIFSCTPILLKRKRIHFFIFLVEMVGLLGGERGALSYRFLWDISRVSDNIIYQKYDF